MDAGSVSVACHPSRADPWTPTPHGPAASPDARDHHAGRGAAAMRRRGGRLLATGAALALVTVTAVLGMHRLFTDGSYRGPLLLDALAAHVVVAVLRRRGVHLVPAAAVTAGAAALVLAWTTYPETTAWLLPTGHTLRAAGGDLSAAWEAFGEMRAPAPVADGFLVAAGAAVWVIAYLADLAAFRVAATFEALLPSATLFLFAAALGAPGGRVPGAAAYAAAALAFVLVHRTRRQEEAATWTATHRSRGRWSLLGTGAALGSAAVVAGALTGPRLPGTDADPVLAWRDVGNDEPTRIVVSPLVDIQTRLIDQADVELFAVRSPRPSYWRLTALDEFDGQIWRSSYGTDDADGELPRAAESHARTETVAQTVTVSALAAVWLPAAFEPAAIDAGATEVGWDEESGTLLVERDVATSDGLAYDVQSAVPRWTAAELRTASSDVPDGIAARYLQLPDDLDPAVEALARDVTEGATTPYGQALALQDYLRSFTYDLDVPPSNANDALTAFLFDTRRGYCQQFAGAFAALARSIDIPTRIAVGFTPGIQDPNDPRLFRVRGEHAHAWNEIYLDGFGWVIVDPTPGRAPPGAQDWLGVPEQQDAPGGDGTLATTPPPDGTDPGDGLASDPAGDAARNPDANLEGLSTAAGPTAGRDGASVAALVRRAGLVVAVAVGGYLVAVPTAPGLQRALRRRRASTPAAKVRLAWTNALDTAAAVGVPLPASLTVAEIAERLATVAPGAAGAVHTVAWHMDKVVYAELAPTPDDVAAAARAGTVVQGALRARLSLGRRIARRFDVRQLGPPRRRPARRRIEPAWPGLRE